MFRRIRSTALLAVLGLGLSACAMGEAPDLGAGVELGDEQATPLLPIEEVVDEPADARVVVGDVLDPMFTEAASTYNVPQELLQAVAFTQTRWQMVVGEEEFEGAGTRHGLLALTAEQLEEGAALAEVSLEAAHNDPMAHLLAGAALFSAAAEAQGIDRGDLASWAPVVAELSGIEGELGLSQYIHEGVYETLRQGMTAYTADGDVAVVLEAANVDADFERTLEPLAAGPDYADSVWRPSPNYNSRPSGSIGDPAMVVIHTCEGSYSSCWSWLTNSASGVSAHYVVNESGSQISQLVRESQRAWHIGASYQCSNNSSVDCWRNGYSSNHFTIGIEHGGFASQSSFPSGQIDASARLVCDITRDQGIPRDRYHIVSHGQLQPYNRTDPGPNWPWTTYLNKINSYCGSGGGGGGGEIVIDSNNNNNNTSLGYVQVSSNWTSSANVSGYYGTGYWWASTQSVSDGAVFYFYLPSAATKTVDAWWTAASDRSSSAPFVMQNASGSGVGTVYRDQRTNGGRWNTLGTFNFSAGWNKVIVSRWTGADGVVIADAVRVR
ncbi:N-acetylmuramoyl-L-alanine amidase [Haliangium ochraceum]|uniref:N-acetylmuramoyl-L-alanine amidase n=1 Tax=Haliangium ochraceum (strain DSM 14365 / JCM 11303 / SMP-2) TaxID=502025 RepID=D0LQ75_HALO1|nr:N-acetylmuramoyl-L-alanine amidase [Haliangium ochraceum]ACY18884.1 N-acetylmuramyl-L-alanine amidase, negative regulator of AmpC, AmpD [Haliangium ochraceum DSM 14365]